MDDALEVSFFRFDHDAELVALPGDLAALMAGIAARQSQSATAAAAMAVRAAFGERDRAPAGEELLAPTDGAFNEAVATAIIGWRQDGHYPPNERQG